MYPDTYVPPDFIPATEGAVIELDRAVDHVASLSQKLGPRDVEAIRKSVNRLLALLMDVAERRAA